MGKRRSEADVPTRIAEGTMAKKMRKSARKYSGAASHEVELEMRRYNRGTAKSGRGGKTKVKSRKQAIAIALSEARKKGMKVPKRRATKRK